MHTLTHTQAQQAMHAALSGAISPGQQAALDAHLAGCPDCRLEADKLSALDAGLRHSLHARLDDQLRARPGPLSDPLTRLPGGERRPSMKPAFSLSSGILLAVVLIGLAAVLTWLLPRSGVVPGGPLPSASPAPLITAQAMAQNTAQPAPTPFTGPGTLIPPPQSVCDAAMQAVSERLKLSGKVNYNASFTGLDPIDPSPSGTGRVCEIRWVGPMMFGSLQEVFDQITPWALNDQKYRTDSVSTAFRQWGGVYRQVYRVAVLDASWKPLPSEACPDQDVASDCPLPAEQKRLEVTLRLADDPLSQAVDTSLSRTFERLAAGEAQALESLSPALQAQVKDAAGLREALGIEDPGGKYDFTFEVRTAGEDAATITLTVWQRFGRTQEWLAERLVSFSRQGEGWAIESIQPSPP